MDLKALCVPDVQARSEFLMPHPTQICLNLVLPISYIMLVFTGWELVLRLLSLHLEKNQATHVHVCVFVLICHAMILMAEILHLQDMNFLNPCKSLGQFIRTAYTCA